jgi:hypothetical protein
MIYNSHFKQFLGIALGCGLNDRGFDSLQGLAAFFFLLSLAPQPGLGLGLLHKIRLNFSIIFFFYRVGLLAPRPTPIPEDQASVFIFPRGKVATHFSRLLRHAWVTVGLFLFPGHHMGSPARFTPRERGPGTHWIGGLVSTRVCLNTLPGLESPFIQPVAQFYTTELSRLQLDLATGIWIWKITTKD